jgi:anti-sigma factor RsiW
MNCQDVQPLLGPYIDEEVAVDVLALINCHLVDCRDCEEERANLLTVKSCIREHLAIIQPSAGFMDRLKEGVQSRRLAARRQERSKTWRHLLPLSAVAATVIFCLIPQQSHVLQTVKMVLAEKSKSLTANALYSYEHNIKIEKAHTRIEKELSQGSGRFRFKPPSFLGWRMVEICSVEVNSIKAIKYSYIQDNSGGAIQEMSCYELPGGMFDDTALAHHNIDGRSICCGTDKGVSLVSWTAGKTDFVLVSELPRADLLEIALQS